MLISIFPDPRLLGRLWTNAMKFTFIGIFYARSRKSFTVFGICHARTRWNSCILNIGARCQLYDRALVLSDHINSYLNIGRYTKEKPNADILVLCRINSSRKSLFHDFKGNVYLMLKQKKLSGRIKTQFVSGVTKQLFATAIHSLSNCVFSILVFLLYSGEKT